MLSFKCNLASPDLPKNHKVYRVLETLTEPIKATKRDYYWGPECFYLNNTKLYTELSEEGRSKVLSEISESLLQEAYFIEKAGIAFASKMVILSESTQEREMYSHFASQEANHLHMLRPFLKSIDYTDSPFLQLLTGLIESGDKQCLTFVIQIMLEGLGLTHYKQLSLNCIEPTLQVVLESILRDEAQHYRSGIALFDQNSLNNEQRQWISRAVSLFHDHVYKGPLRVVNAIYQFYPKLTIYNKDTLQDDIKASEQIKQTMDTLTKLTGVKHG